MRAPRRESGRVTLADVAASAAVSPSTASFVLSGRTDMRISTATAEKVHREARRLGYVAPSMRRPLSPQGMPVIAFVSDTIASEPFGGQMIRGAMSAAAEAGRTVVVAESEGPEGPRAELIDELVTQGVDRMIYATTSTQEVSLTAPPPIARTVLLNCTASRLHLPSIVPDDEGAGRLAATTLLEAGHRDRIWVVGETPAHTAGHVRATGILDVLAAHDVALAHQVTCRWWPPDAHAAVATALADAVAAGRPPTGVIAMNDRVAMGVYQAAADLALRIPEDLSVISFDNSDLAWWLSPGLTSVGLPFLEMGRRAVEAMLDVSRSGVDRVEAPLHPRESVAPPA